MFEVRADLVLDLDLLAILRARTKPLLLTCRAESEGGRCADDDLKRRRTLLEAVKRGLRLRGHRAPQRAPRRDAREGRARARRLVPRLRGHAGRPRAALRLHARPGRGRGEDRGHAALDRRRGAADGLREARQRRRRARPWSRSPWARWGSPPASSPGGSARPSPSPPWPRARSRRRGRSRPPIMANLYRVGRGDRAPRASTAWSAPTSSRSLSPILHNRAFAARGMDAVYVPLQAERLRAFLRRAARARAVRLQRHAPVQGGHPPAPAGGRGAGGGLRQRQHRGRRGRGTLRGSTTDGLGVARLAEEARRREGARGGDPRRGRGGAVGRALAGQEGGGGDAARPRSGAGRGGGARRGLRATARWPTPRAIPGTSSSTPRPSAPAPSWTRRPCRRRAAPAGHGRAGHGLRPAGDAPAEGGAGRRLYHRRRDRDAGRAGGRAVRDLDGARGPGRRHAQGRGLPRPGAARSAAGATRGRSCSRASAARARRRSAPPAWPWWAAARWAPRWRR